MRIKPKNPKVLRVRRIVLGILGFVAVLVVLLWPKGSDELPDDTAVETESAVTANLDGELTAGELDWEYPEGWVDLSDLPPRESLGDEEHPGLANWRYLLVNGLSQENYLRESYYPDMRHVESGYSFQTRAADQLVDFLMDARAQGYIVSMARTYYSYGQQRTRFNGLASIRFDEGDISLADAEREMIEKGYYPGADEHQTGLAVNFVDENGEAKFSTPVLQWMTEHCAEYGFILRYPEGREEFTGHDAEPGHYRYVGELAAEFIMRKGITLEEFVAAYKDEEEEEAKKLEWKW